MGEDAAVMAINEMPSFEKKITKKNFKESPVHTIPEGPKDGCPWVGKQHVKMGLCTDTLF